MSIYQEAPALPFDSQLNSDYVFEEDQFGLSYYNKLNVLAALEDDKNLLKNNKRQVLSLIDFIVERQFDPGQSYIINLLETFFVD
uniref:Uncharacterized protein n=1 Tax=Romanomermis culicivorax TaxID=13658 RepID=A0A915L7X5_ROMCU